MPSLRETWRKGGTPLDEMDVTPSAPPQPEPGKPIEQQTPTGPSFEDLRKDLQQVPEGPGELKGTGSKEDFKVRPIPKGEKPNVLRTDPATNGKTKVSVVESRTAGSPLTKDFYNEPGDPTGVYKSGSAQTKRSQITGIQADIGEMQAYKNDLLKGEYGMQQPLGSNVPGADYIMARRADGKMWIVVKDAKTSVRGKFSKPDPHLKKTWLDAAKDAVDRMDFEDKALQKEIQEAFDAGRIIKEQVNVDYSPEGQGKISVPKP
jgi:hypothetical protein